MARTARTGEFPPPGRTRRARSYSAAERASRRDATGRAAVPRPSDTGVLALPGLEVVREVQEPDLLELRARVERGAALDAVEAPGDRIEDGVALLLGAPVGH